MLFRGSVNYEELLTLIIEAEGIINSRPLTYVYTDELDEILTPSHLVIGRRLLSQFSEIDGDVNADNAVLTKRMKYLKSLSEHFWERFKGEYLLDLRSHHKLGSESNRTPVVGEVVVVEGKSNRNSWRLGKIVILLPGKDERNRSVVVKIFDGDKIRYLRRPIERLYPIEVQSTLNVTQDEIDKAKDACEAYSTKEENVPSDRPVRIAADNGILLRRILGQS